MPKIKIDECFKNWGILYNSCVKYSVRKVIAT